MRNLDLLLACCSLLGVTERAAADQRLGPDVVPTFEAVTLHLDADRPDYTGVVRIELDVLQPTKSFHFHSLGPKFDWLVLQGEDGEFSLDLEEGADGLIKATAETPLAPGSYTLAISFSNEFDTRASGLYRLETGGRAYLFTQFEAVDAREAFPCWDEPTFKIPFQLTVTVPEEHLAVSNTPIEGESLANGRRTVVFQKTKPLPPYLLAIATGPLETVPIPGLSVPGRVVTVAGASHLATEAVKFTPPILAALESYFGQPYPFEKLDLIAVPEFWYGGMENAGAIVFADRVLLLDSGSTSQEQHRRLAGILGHELAHMWFGDLVTMEWWNDFWLNESFASWMGDKVVDQVHPEFELSAAQLEGRENAMGLDSRPGVRAIRKDIDLPIVLQQLADALAYDKGQAVLGMLEHWLGQETFRQGVLTYLKTHQWDNATAADLWGALSETAGQDLKPCLSSFLDQPGVPLVSADLLSDGRVRLSQRRFLNYGVEAPGPSRWLIPIRFKYSDGETVREQSVLLSETTQIVQLESGRTPTWLHPNAGESGYYLWQVSPEILQLLAEQAPELMDLRERCGFFNNLTALLRADIVSGDDYLRTLSMFAEDPEPKVIAALLHSLNKVRLALVAPEAEDAFAVYVRRTLGPAARRFGLTPSPDEKASVTLLRPILLSWLGEHGKDPRVLSHADSLATVYLADPSSCEPSLADEALKLRAMRGDRALFETLQQRFESATTPVERPRLLAALGSFRNPEILTDVLDYSLQGPLRPNEIRVISQTASEARASQKQVFEWTIENYDAIAARIPSDWTAALPSAGQGCSRERLAKAQRFYQDPGHRPPGTEITLTKVSDEVSECATLHEREGPKVTEYLHRLAQAP